MGQSTPHTPCPSLKLLVVDDEASTRTMARVVLQASGHDVDEGRDGRDAVAALMAVAYDVVIMDVRMPGLDGLEATRRIRNLGGQAARVPILGLTGIASAAECAAAGMTAHLPKGPHTLQLARAVERLARQDA